MIMNKEKQIEMEWIDVNERMPLTEFEEDNTPHSMGSRYFSKKIEVKRGKQKIKAWYQNTSSYNRFISVRSATEIVNVSHWRPIEAK